MDSYLFWIVSSGILYHSSRRTSSSWLKDDGGGNLVPIIMERGSSRSIMSSALTFAAVILWFLDKILFYIYQSLSPSFHFQPLLLLADDVLPRFVHAIKTLEPAALDTLNKVAILFKMFQLNLHQLSVLFENQTSLPFCSTFIRTVTKYHL